MNLTQQVTWIPVEDRLPDGGGMFPVATQKGGTDIAAHYGGRWYAGTVGMPTPLDVTDQTTHWAEPLKHPSDLALIKRAEREAAALDFAKNGRRCGDCGARISECECN